MYLPQPHTLGDSTTPSSDINSPATIFLITTSSGQIRPPVTIQPVISEKVVIDRRRLSGLLERERETYRSRNPRSQAAYAAARHLFGRVPMTWMNKSAGGFPLYLSKARGAHVEDIDGHDLIDFCLGDTGAMAGHSPAATVEAVQRRFSELGGATAMMPSEDAAWVGAGLARRFGLPYWSVALTATDANRWAVRLARAVTGRPKILVNNYCYHGIFDDSLIVIGTGGGRVARLVSAGRPLYLLSSL